MAPSGVEGSLRSYGALRSMMQTSVTGIWDILGGWGFTVRFPVVLMEGYVKTQ